MSINVFNENEMIKILERNFYEIGENEFDEMQKEILEDEKNGDFFNSIFFDETIDGFLMYFDGLETLKDFENYVSQYENTVYKVLNKKNEIILYAFHSII